MAETSPRDTRLLRSITLRNILSFGPQTEPLALESLNVLIGPNGSGKSNLIEAVGLLRATAGDLGAAIRRGGGAAEWVWKGQPSAPAVIEVDVTLRDITDTWPVRHALSLMYLGAIPLIIGERLDSEMTGDVVRRFSYQDRAGQAVVNLDGNERILPSKSVTRDRSVLSQLRDPETYLEIYLLADAYTGIRTYREWTFGRNSIFREPQRADMRNDRLEEDFSNLGLILNRLRGSPPAKRAILDGLHGLYERFDDFDVSVQGGTVQVFFTEGDFTIPATRLSDGTLRYLCLLAILCDPQPPPLICIEEPELGLHPDILPKVADLLVSAAGRTQLIVTTHSDILVDALTERPGAVVVCENHDGQTTMRRLDAQALGGWLDKYRLGQLWTKGQIGGTRW